MSQYLTILYQYQHTCPKAQTLSWRMALFNKPVTHCYVIIKCMYCTTWSYIRHVDTVGIEIDLTVPLVFSLHLSSYSCVCSVHHTWTHIQTNIQTCSELHDLMGTHWNIKNCGENYQISIEGTSSKLHQSIVLYISHDTAYIHYSNTCTLIHHNLTM